MQVLPPHRRQDGQHWADRERHNPSTLVCSPGPAKCAWWGFNYFRVCLFYLARPVVQGCCEPQEWFIQTAGMAPDRVSTMKSMPFLHSECFPPCIIKPNPTSGVAATVRIICFLLPWVLLFNWFLLIHLKSDTQFDQNYEQVFGARVWAYFIWYPLKSSLEENGRKAPVM